MKIELTTDLKLVYPKAMFGSLTVKNVLNTKSHEILEEQKRDLERKIREVYREIDKDSTIQGYNTYFKRWARTYPVESQIKAIQRGGNFPQVSVLVDSMFLAELKNKYLTSCHNLDAIKGNLVFVSSGGERYLKLNGKEQKLVENDAILKDEEGVIASVLHGPARRTSIETNTTNALYLVWCPYGMSEQLIILHLNDILSNLHIIFGSVASEVQIHQ